MITISTRQPPSDCIQPKALLNFDDETSSLKHFLVSKQTKLKLKSSNVTIFNSSHIKLNIFLSVSFLNNEKY